MILGFSGSGKSTLARKLGWMLHITPIHMDVLHWRPGWVESSLEEKVKQLRPLLQNKKWIIDGVYRRVLFEERLALCDTIIFLDINRFTCFFHAVKRRIYYRGKSRPDMAQGCPEKLDMEFVKWLLWDGRLRRKELYKILKYQADKNIFIFHSTKQAEQFLESLGGIHDEITAELAE